MFWKTANEYCKYENKVNEVAVCNIDRMLLFEFANTPLRRLRGLMFGKQRGKVLVFPYCNDVHTYGMRKPVDIAFVGGWGTVIQAYRSVPAGRRLRERSAAYVLERYADESARWFEPGDVIDFDMRTPPDDDLVF